MSSAFESKVMAAAEVHLKNLFMDDVVYGGMPPLLTNRAISVSANEKLLQHERNSRQQVLHSLQVDDAIVNVARQDILDNIPCADQHPMEIVQARDQTLESFNEQELAFNLCQQAIEGYCNPDTVFEQSILLTGPPGAGKTYLFQKTILYAMLRGLRIAVTATMSERARSLGGEHVHWLFGIPVTSSENETTLTLALKTIASLGTKPQNAAFLKRIDVLFYDEVGQCSAETFMLLDIVLRSIKGVEQPMGGVLCIATGELGMFQDS